MSAKEYRKRAQQYDKKQNPQKDNENKQKNQKQKNKGKKSKTKEKKDKKPLTEAEKKVEAVKLEFNAIYDCLMNQQCLIQYGKYGSYIPLEQMG